MFERLLQLYELQLIDSQLDELEELRGDLPLAVNNLKSQLNTIDELVKSKTTEKETSSQKRINNEEEIERLNENLKKFKAQLFQVRNNKEYDALTKEIDNSEATIEKLIVENLNIENNMSKLNNEIEELTPELDKLNEELKIKTEDLTKIITANEKEEIKWREKREKLAELIKKPDLNTYMRIRKAKNGVAIAVVNRSACSGCHNIIPSQRQLEVKQNKRIYSCESCGRILVSTEISDLIESRYK